jgi:hypothetical protein
MQIRNVHWIYLFPAMLRNIIVYFCANFSHRSTEAGPRIFRVLMIDLNSHIALHAMQWPLRGVSPHEQRAVFDLATPYWSLSGHPSPLLPTSSSLRPLPTSS